MKIPLLKDTFMEINEINCETILYQYICTDSRSLVNVPYENSVSLPFCTNCCFVRIIGCNNDNSVQTVIINGNTCILRHNHVLNVFLCQI